MVMSCLSSGLISASGTGRRPHGRFDLVLEICDGVKPEIAVEPRPGRALGDHGRAVLAPDRAVQALVRAGVQPLQRVVGELVQALLREALLVPVALVHVQREALEWADDEAELNREF